MSWIANATDKLRGLFSAKEASPESAVPSATESRPKAKAKSEARSTDREGRIHRPSYIAVFDRLADIVELDGKPHFLMIDDGRFCLETSAKVNNRIYCPPRLERIPFPLENGNEALMEIERSTSRDAIEESSDLFESVKEYLYLLSDLPTPEHYDLCATWILLTYRIEATQFSPIIWLCGVPEHGKTRTGKGMIQVAYRGLHVESLNPAYILRVSREWGAALFIDVVDAWRRAEKSDSVDILLLRYERDAKVPRVLHLDKGPFEDIEYFSIFGPTILGTNVGVHPSLESRSIQIVMPESARNFDRNVTPDLAKTLRLRLLAYRARCLGQSFPPNEKRFPGRFGDLVRPLCQIVLEAAPHRCAVLEELLWQVYEDRLSAKSECFEATVLTALVQLYGEVKNGLLPVKRITEKVNEDRLELQKLSSPRVGSVLKSLGFVHTRATKTGGSCSIWDQHKLDQVLMKYGLSGPSDASDRSECRIAAGKRPEPSEKSEATGLPL